MNKRALIKLPVLVIAVAILVSSFMLPSNAVAQGRGHGRGQARKSAKFINRHDARDGRWDGRGPRAKRVIRSRTYRGHGRHKGWIKRR